MPYEIIFAIPFIAGIGYVIREAILYNKEMKQWINHPNWEFTVIEKDGLPYVVPRSTNLQQVEHRD